MSSPTEYVPRAQAQGRLSRVTVPAQAYERTSFLIAGQWGQVSSCAIAIASLALGEIDITTHEGSHPQIGAVDHISVSSLDADASGRAAAMRIATAMAEKVPVYLYGDAHPEHRSLAATRRLTPYFRATNGWKAPADLGQDKFSDKSGVCCCGHVDMVLNYNIALEEAADLAVAKAVVAEVRKRPHVEALPLPHGQGYEVACNLLRPEVTPPEDVLEAARLAAAQFNVRVERGYRIGLTPEEIRARLTDAT